jgi:hypothetical protein
MAFAYEFSQAIKKLESARTIRKQENLNEAQREGERILRRQREERLKLPEGRHGLDDGTTYHFVLPAALAGARLSASAGALTPIEGSALAKQLKGLELLDGPLGMLLFDLKDYMDWFRFGDNQEAAEQALPGGLTWSEYREEGLFTGFAVHFARGGIMFGIECFDQERQAELKLVEFKIATAAEPVMVCSTSGSGYSKEGYRVGPFLFGHVSRFIDGKWVDILRSFSEECRVAVPKFIRLRDELREKKRIEALKDSFGL